MHLTVRMAWHDNNWNGKVCCNPEANTYCTGAHSLLSGRIEKKKNTAFEQKEGVKDEYVAKNFDPANVPPCYWSINAFGDQEFPVEHHHAFKWVKHTIPDVIKKYSVITWPFKLSFVHNEENKKKYGNYWPDLNQRIGHYIDKFQPGESIIFFYANYDNPVSADDMKYLLLGCSVIKERPTPKHFAFEEAQLAEIRSPKKKTKKVGQRWEEYTDVTMTNFPTINWMLQFSHDPDTSVLLPYKEYIQYTENIPDQEHLLQDMKVIIEEESLIRGFKYVSMDIDDDKCLYLLYKLRRSIKKIQEHHQQVVKSDLKEQEDRIDQLIAKTWNKRGIYPSLASVLGYFIDDDKKAHGLAIAIQTQLTPKNDLSDFFDTVLKKQFPDGLGDFEDELYDLAENRIFKKYHDSFARLSLFVLTPHQVEKIIDNKELLQKLATNPYVLYEEYEAGEDNLDIPDMQDEPIDVFKVDMGMIPDKKYTQRHRKLQNLHEDSPERIRSVIINYLQHISASGHCYDTVQAVLKNLYEYPLIYKNDIKLDDEALLQLDQDYKSHFSEKLFIREIGQEKYFYLKVVKQAEEFLSDLVSRLIRRPLHEQYHHVAIDQYINDSLQLLSKVIRTKPDQDLFAAERKQLYKNSFERSFFLLTGKPGAGKTYETSKIIEHLYQTREEVLILAPTGKAALRVTENIRKHTSLAEVSAKTIDKYIFEKGFGWMYEDWEGALVIPEEQKLSIDNLIIDESSMLDLNKLTLLLSIVKITDKYPKRIILVGDENQLPPIGYGKPFQDMVRYVQEKDELAANHYISLVSNCRQENDEQILKLAEAFTDKTRCYEEAFNIIDSGEGQKSEGLFVYKWKTQEQLNTKIDEALNTVFEAEGVKADDDFERLNLLFGLYKNGYVNQQNGGFADKLQLEQFQILSPYRTGYYGTLGINRYIQSGYRYKQENGPDNKYFWHADKIIRLYNWYWGKGKNRRLELSNGSIGLVNIGENYRKYFFKDRQGFFWNVDDEENFDLAYAITVHKSQGSDFKNVFLVIPQKESLLCRELLYTALTRSKFRLFIFVQDAAQNLLMKAKNNSQLIHRNTSVFKEPIDRMGKYSPEAGVTVASKAEYIIYTALQKSGLQFKYEAPLAMRHLTHKIHPDFTIFLRNGQKIYWEHLGMLDTRKYYRDWQNRRKDYTTDGLEEFLLTTDDLEGLLAEKLYQVIEGIKEMSLKQTPGNKFSAHHYELY